MKTNPYNCIVWLRLQLIVGLVTMKNKERKSEVTLFYLISDNYSCTLNASFVSVLLRPLRTYERLHAGMRRATVQREAPQSVHVHADAARIRKGYKETSKYNCTYCEVR